MFEKQQMLKKGIREELALLGIKKDKPLPDTHDWLDEKIKEVGPITKEENNITISPKLQMTWKSFKNEIETTGFTPLYINNLLFIQLVIRELVLKYFYNNGGKRRRRSTKRKTKRSKRKQKRNTKRRASHRRRR